MALGRLTLATLALLASPLLGPASWAPVAEHLRAGGWDVMQPRAPRATPNRPDDVITYLLGELPTDRDLVLVPHSNAGLYVPAISAERPVVGCVFVDARLPTVGEWVSPALREKLAGLVDADGRLPPWTGWWSDLDGLFPDDDTRAAIEREQPRLPFSFYDHVVPVPAGWSAGACAYLAFGETYGAQRREAAEQGWPTMTVAGHHLHMLMDPAGVATSIAALLATIGCSRGSDSA